MIQSGWWARGKRETRHLVGTYRSLVGTYSYRTSCTLTQVDERGRLRVFHFDAGVHEQAVLAALAEPAGKSGAGAKTLVTRMDPVKEVVQEWAQGGASPFNRGPKQQAEALRLTALCGGCASPHGLKVRSGVLCRRPP